MNFWETFKSIVFKKDANESVVFYPWSILGAGFIVSSDEKYYAICHLFKKMLKIFIPLIIIVLIALEWVELPEFQWVFVLSVMGLLFIILGLGYYFSTRKITRDLEKTPDKMRLSDIYEEIAKLHGIPVLIVIEVLSLIIVVCGALFLLIDQYLITAWIMVIFFALVGYVIKNILAKKIQQLK